MTSFSASFESCPYARCAFAADLVVVMLMFSESRLPHSGVIFLVLYRVSGSVTYVNLLFCFLCVSCLLSFCD
jgi:hypothetical protein